MLTWFFAGTGYEVADFGLDVDVRKYPALPPIYFSGPQNKPAIIWNPGDVRVMSIGFYPQAFAALTRCDVANFVDRSIAVVPAFDDEFVAICATTLNAGEPIAAFDFLQDALERRWRNLRPGGESLGRRVRDWAPAIAREAAGSLNPCGARQAERRIKKWIGQAHRRLAFYLRAERFFEQALDRRGGEPLWSAVAFEAGFADQSHMIRDMRRLTGFSPRALFRRLDEEPFWCYRLFADHFADKVE